MALIACTTGTLALYRQDDGSTLAVPVEAWSSEEPFTAFVAGPDAHLVAANSRAGFLRLEMAALVVPPQREVGQPERLGRAPRPGRRRTPQGPRERPGA